MRFSRIQRAAAMRKDVLVRRVKSFLKKNVAHAKLPTSSVRVAKPLRQSFLKRLS